MNLYTLKNVVADYHGKVASDLVSGSVDIFLVALNNARRKAEKDYDFEYSRLTATVNIDGVNGGALSSATITPANTFASIKSVTDVSAATSGGYLAPLDFMRAGVANTLDRNSYEMGVIPNRYPSDADIEAYCGAPRVVQRGGSLFIYPRQANPAAGNLGTLYLEGYGWLNDYVAADLTGTSDPAKDFFVEYGFEWLMWTCVIALNYKYQTFVPRQEGNVGSPERERASAWDDLIKWDSYLIDPNSTTER